MGKNVKQCHSFTNIFKTQDQASLILIILALESQWRFSCSDINVIPLGNGLGLYRGKLVEILL